MRFILFFIFLLAFIVMGIMSGFEAIARPPLPTTADNFLIEAARAGDKARLDIALAQGYDINKRGLVGRTALQIASAWRQAAMVDYLISKGADVNIAARDRATALSLAITFADAGIVAQLLEAGADPNQPAEDHALPLIMATRKGLLEIVKMLLAAGADRQAGDHTGRTAYDWAQLNRHRALMAALAPPQNKRQNP